MIFSQFTVDLAYFFSVVFGDVMRVLAAAGIAAAVLYGVIMITVHIVRYD